MSLERVLKTLESFGLSRVESEVYVYLAKAGPSKAKDLTPGLRMHKQQLCQTLKKLEKKGIVTVRPERTPLYSALAFDELLSRYVKLNVEQAAIIRETKKELLDSWRKMGKKNNT